MFFVFQDSYVLCIYMNIRCTFRIFMYMAIVLFDIFGARARHIRIMGKVRLGYQRDDQAKNIGSISSGLFRRSKEREKTQGPLKKETRKKKPKTRKTKCGAPRKRKRKKKKHNCRHKAPRKKEEKKEEKQLNSKRKKKKKKEKGRKRRK